MSERDHEQRRATAKRLPARLASSRGGRRRDANASDTTLAAAAARGDRRSLDRLLERHVDRVYGICRRVLGNHDDALDATQEALLTIARRIGTHG